MNKFKQRLKVIEYFECYLGQTLRMVFLEGNDVRKGQIIDYF